MLGELLSNDCPPPGFLSSQLGRKNFSGEGKGIAVVKHWG